MATPLADRSAQSAAYLTNGSILSRVYARVGLLGNPSDGFFGRTISFSLANFYAQVTLEPVDAGISFLPHPQHDCTYFDDFNMLTDRIESQGYYGGIRLLMAVCKCFVEHCRARGHMLPARGFRMSYETTVPRQAGLSGSSAIVTAALNCLLLHYGVPDEVLPVAERPSLVLSAESELGITAGLQDRVIQVYGGLVSMDFGRAHMEATGRGCYESLDPNLLPRLWLVYCDNPSDSGRVHSSVKARWLAGDADVIAGMSAVADCAQRGRDALLAGDMRGLAQLMDTNFDMRRRMFGDEALGETNLRMVRVCRSVGAAAKFTGSGGAVVALCPEGEAQEAKLREVCSAAGFECMLAQVAPALYTARPED